MTWQINTLQVNSPFPVISVMHSGKIARLEGRLTYLLQILCKGFVCMSTAESPQIFIKILLRRLEEKVMAERRVFLYDNSINLHKTALNRGAKDILKFKILTDRYHWKNYTGCSDSYHCDNYDFIKDVNSQTCEQKNRSRKLFSNTGLLRFQ